MHVILLHNELCSESLILCANEHHNYKHIVEMLPLRNALRVSIICFINTIKNSILYLLKIYKKK